MPHYNTKDNVDFTINLTASHIPTRACYWDIRLPELIPGQHRGWWTLTTGHPIEPVARDVLAAFRGYGWPALQAALDSPGFPPDPAFRWPRTFVPEPSIALRPVPPHDATHPAQDPRDDDQETDALFAEITDHDPDTRFTTTDIIISTATSDPRTRPALLNRLASDPDTRVRQLAARGLTQWATQEVRHALQAAAAQDEDLTVRWAARYAIRLAFPPGPETT